LIYRIDGYRGIRVDIGGLRVKMMGLRAKLFGDEEEAAIDMRPGLRP
jgi:hypothetical protein